jgi:hypothetical protein
VLWQEFRDHDALINNALTEALQIHGGPFWRIFQVSVFVGVVAHSLIRFVFVRLLIPLSPMFLTAGDRSWRVELEQGTAALLS